MQIAAGAPDFEIAEAGIESVAQHRGGLGRSLEAEHTVRPGFAGKDVSLTSGFAGTLR
jgi:hypothetical protein